MAHFERNETQGLQERVYQATGQLPGAIVTFVSSFILASASPRRIELLRKAGFDFRVEPATIEESHATFLTPEELTLFNAIRKTTAVASQYPKEVVLGADTIVTLNSEVFGKPSDLEDARRMLRQLVGNYHEVITGVAVVHPGRRPLISRAVRTRVKFRALSNPEIEAYLKIAEPLDKAGAYAAQTATDLIIERVIGSFSNVVGLPMEIVCPLLESLGIHKAPRQSGRLY